MSEYVNKAIECSIENCKYHCCNSNYCSRESIRVGSHECNPTVKPCTDCQSFELK